MTLTRCADCLQSTSSYTRGRLLVPVIPWLDVLREISLQRFRLLVRSAIEQIGMRTKTERFYEMIIYYYQHCSVIGIAEWVHCVFIIIL